MIVRKCEFALEKAMKEQLLQFWNDEEGVTTLEYAILAALLLGGLTIAVATLTDGLGEFFQAITDKLTGLAA